MLLDMLTADAAAKHGHEYSPPQPSRSASPNNGHFLSQMPLSIFTSVIRGQNASPAPSDSLLEDSKSPADTREQPPSNQKPHIQVNSSVISPPPSRPASAGSGESLDERPKKRGHRSRTIFNLAQPPPVTGPRHKLHIRPKVLLQLHQVYAQRRPKPAYEVIPFSLLAPRSTRRLARTFNTREKLGPNDLLIVKAEDYGINEEEKTDDERWGSRDVIGIICPKKGDKDAADRTEILMDDGSNWEVTHLPNGGYEFNFLDEHGLLLKSRWVPKPVHSRRVSTMSSSSQAHASPILGAEEKKFNFSTISANSRRHPVIATMCRANINILDSYNMPTATSPSSPAGDSDINTPDITPLVDAGSFLEKNSDRLKVTTDDALRRFIAVSGIWVAFSEQWSAAYNSSKNAICNSCPLPTVSTSHTITPSRTVSMSFLDSPRSVSPASTIDDNRRSIPRLIRASTQKLQRNSSFTKRAPSPVSARTSPTSSPRITARSRRSNSTGNADLNPKYGSLRRRHGAAFEEPSLPETEEERQSKRSVELLRIREMTLPDTPPESTNSTPTTLAPKLSEPTPETRSRPPLSPGLRAAKSQSAYEPVTTAGMWDSGVTEGPGLKARPTSLFVLNEKKQKAKKKEERSKSKEKKKDKKEKPRKSESFTQRFIGIFRREKN